MDKTFVLPHRNVYARPEDKPTIEIEIGDEYWSASLVLLWNVYGCCLTAHSDAWAILPHVVDALMPPRLVPPGEVYVRDLKEGVEKLKDTTEGELIALLLAAGFEDVTVYPKPDPNSLRERLAADEHDRWSGWMKYLFAKGGYFSMGSWCMRHADEVRWRRQMTTNYTDLTEKEKDSDRKEADRILAILKRDG